MKTIFIAIGLFLSAYGYSQVLSHGSSTSSSSIDAYTKTQSDARYTTTTSVRTIVSDSTRSVAEEVKQWVRDTTITGTDSATVDGIARSAINDSLSALSITVDVLASGADSVMVVDGGKIKVMPASALTVSTTALNNRIDSLNNVISNIYSLLSGLGYDLQAPSLDSIVLGGQGPSDYIFRLYFNEQLNQDSVPSHLDFTVTENGNAFNLSSSGVSDSMVTVSGATPAYGNTYLLSYAKGDTAIQDTTENKVANWTGHTVVNRLPEPVAPLYPALLDDENTIAWYIADAANLTVSNDSVSQWNDLSGNDYHITATGTARPIFDGDSITFDGVNDGLSRASMTYSQPITIYFVFKHITNISSGDFVCVNTSPAARLQESYNGSDYIELHAGLGLNVVCSLNEFHIVRAVINGASSEVQVDDATPVTGDAGARTMTELYVGTGAAPSNISVKELIIRGATDDAQDEQDVMDYLNDKYSIY